MKLGAYKPRGFGRMLQLGTGDIWFIMPTLSNLKDQIFFTKFTDVATMTWITDLKCTEIHTYDPTTIYSTYSYGNLGGDGTSMLASYFVGAAFN